MKRVVNYEARIITENLDGRPRKRWAYFPIYETLGEKPLTTFDSELPDVTPLTDGHPWRRWEGKER